MQLDRMAELEMLDNGKRKEVTNKFKGMTPKQVDAKIDKDYKDVLRTFRSKQAADRFAKTADGTWYVSKVKRDDNSTGVLRVEYIASRCDREVEL